MRIREYLDTSAKIDKTKSTLLSQTFKVEENRVPLVVFGSGAEI